MARKSGPYLLLLRHRRHPLSIQLDNTLFTNTGGAQGTVGKLDYTEGLTADQLRWLEADLQRVPAGKTVFVGMHIQFTNRYRIADGKLSWSYAMPADCRAKMLDLLAPYTVHFVTGHTHINYANRITERMTEHNIAAVCATWWWTGNYTNGRTQMCRDGAPAGYGLFEIGTAGADDVQWHYQGIGKAADSCWPVPWRACGRWRPVGGAWPIRAFRRWWPAR